MAQHKIANSLFPGILLKWDPCLWRANSIGAVRNQQRLVCRRSAPARQAPLECIRPGYATAPALRSMPCYEVSRLCTVFKVNLGALCSSQWLLNVGRCRPGCLLH